VDLQKVILKEYAKAQVNKIVTYVGNNPSRFKHLIEVYLAGPYRITQRASWPLSYCVENYPKLILPHIKSILDILNEPNVHDAVKRNTVRLLQYVDLPKKYHGRVVDLCFTFLQSQTEPVAIKAFSITVLDNLTEHEPDLRRELRIIIEDQLPYSSPAFQVRANKFLASFKG
jgi:hypothetical protein